MKLSTLLIAASLALPFTLPAAAYSAGEHRGEKLIETLQLDDARADQVRQILQSSKEKREQLHRDTKKAMKQLHADTQQKLKQILTEEEIAQLEELRAQKRKEHTERNHPHHTKKH